MPPCREKVDSLIIIPNDRLKYVTDQKITFANAFGIADDVLKQAVTSISELIGLFRPGVINLDFADVSAVMKDAGRAHMGVGIASGREKAEQAAMTAVASPLLETSINGATGVLINVTGSPDLGPGRGGDGRQHGAGGGQPRRQHHLRRHVFRGT